MKINLLVKLVFAVALGVLKFVLNIINQFILSEAIKNLVPFADEKTIKVTGGGWLVTCSCGLRGWASRSTPKFIVLKSLASNSTTLLSVSLTKVSQQKKLHLRHYDT